MNPGEEALSPERRGLAIASLVLGIVGLCLSLFVIGAALGVFGVALGLAHVLAKHGRNGMAWWGVSLSLLSLIAGIGLGLAYFKIAKAMKESMASMAGATSQAPDVLRSDPVFDGLPGSCVGARRR